jgi:N-formylglutamate deformylase
MNPKLILHTPHASTHIPFYDGFLVDKVIIQNEVDKLTDHYTDDLFNSNDDIIVKADFSRIFCDVERYADDSKEEMAKYGMGVLYTRSDAGEEIRSISDEIRKRILSNYYWPHYHQLIQAVRSEVMHSGKAIIIDCHSFTDEPFIRDLDQTTPRPDICIGSTPYNTSNDLLETTVEYFKSHGFSIKVNSPYEGSIVPVMFIKNHHVRSIMIEVNRKLYMNVSNGEPNSNYSRLKQILKSYFNKVKVEKLDPNF